MMVDINSRDILLIEKEVVRKINYEDFSNCESLLTLRREMINRQVLEHQEQILPDILAFDEAMTSYLKEIYKKALLLWTNVDDVENDYEDMELSVEYLPDYDECPHLQPTEDYDRKEFWNILCAKSIEKEELTYNIFHFPNDFYYYKDMESNHQAALYLDIGEISKYFKLKIGKEKCPFLNSRCFNFFKTLYSHTYFSIIDILAMRRFKKIVHIDIWE